MTLKARHHFNQVQTQNTNTPRFRTWFGEISSQYRPDISLVLWWISRQDLFSDVRFTCLTERSPYTTGPIYSGKYISQLYDRHSVTDINLSIRV